MDGLIFSAEGWPLTQQAMQQIEQSNKGLIVGLARTFGNNCFLPFDVKLVLGTLPNGYIVHNHELLPFQGGTIQANIVIVEEVTEHGYDVANTGDFSNIQPVWKRRWAKFAPPGTGLEDIATDSLKFVESNEELMTKVRFLKKGGVRIYNNNFDDLDIGWTSATGSFTGAIRQVNTYWNYELIFKITFNSEIAGDYWPLIMQKGGSGNIVNSSEVTSIEKLPGSMTIGLLPYAYVGVDELFNADLEIYLIG